MKNNKIFLFTTLLLGFIFLIQSSFAITTYVGVQILNLTDDPTSSCAGEPGYGNQGRIRALSSILPDFPIYFELKHESNDSIIWSGDSDMDRDYEVGDTIWMPQEVDLGVGESYKLFFDIDAIRIYLPLHDYQDFTATLDDNYWTAGKVGAGGTRWEHGFRSSPDGCEETSYHISNWQYQNFFISYNRTAPLTSVCTENSNSNDCGGSGLIGISDNEYVSGTIDFRIDAKYNNLHTDSVGNFEIQFTFS